MILSTRAALALLLAASPMSHALQSVSARDGDTVVARIAQKEVTRIAVESGRIRKVTGNAGEFVLEKDEARGQIFVRPADPSSTKPINLFLSTDRSTVGLLLQPVDTPSDTILIRERTTTPARKPASASASPHVRSLKHLLLTLATDSPTDDMEMRESALELGFWPGLRMTRVRTLLALHAIGEQYHVVNETRAAVRLEPTDFFKPGVMAVAVTDPEIAPGTGTQVFVIRERKGHE